MVSSPSGGVTIVMLGPGGSVRTWWQCKYCGVRSWSQSKCGVRCGNVRVVSGPGGSVRVVSVPCRIVNVMYGSGGYVISAVSIPIYGINLCYVKTKYCLAISWGKLV